MSKDAGRFRTLVFLSVRQLANFNLFAASVLHRRTLFRGDVVRAAGIARPHRQKSRAVLALLCSLVGCLLKKMNIIR